MLFVSSLYALLSVNSIPYLATVFETDQLHSTSCKSLVIQPPLSVQIRGAVLLQDRSFHLDAAIRIMWVSVDTITQHILIASLSSLYFRRYIAQQLPPRPLLSSLS
jgi:hypothetical protein